jgi:VanZ family protein
MRRRGSYIGIGIIAITLLYIWNNSLQSTTLSNEQSGKVLEIIEDIFHTPPLDTEEAQHIVRKVAHMIEFALLGIEMALLLYITEKMCKRNLVYVLFIGLASAVMDETIQVFSRRGSQVLDVWIDFAGLIVGIGIGLIAYAFIRRLRMYMRKQKHITINDKPVYHYNHARSS